MASEGKRRGLERLLDQIDQAESQRNWESLRTLAQDVVEIDAGNTEAVAYPKSGDRRIGAVPTIASIQPENAFPSPATVIEGQTSDSTAVANGRYQVTRFLGECGNQKVYLVHDSLLDPEVAFALIKTEGLGDAGRSR